MKQDIMMLWLRLPHKVLLAIVVVLLLFQYDWFSSSRGHFSSLVGLPLFLLTLSLSLILLGSWLVKASRYALKLPTVVTLMGMLALIAAYLYLWRSGYSFYPNSLLLTLAVLSLVLVLSAYYSHHRKRVSWITAVLVVLLVPLVHGGMREVLTLYTSGTMVVTLPANQYHPASRLNIPSAVLGDQLHTDSQRRHYKLDLKLQQAGVEGTVKSNIGTISLAKNASTISSNYYMDDWLLELSRHPPLTHYQQLAYYAGNRLPVLNDKQRYNGAIIKAHKSQTDLFLPMLMSETNPQVKTLEFMFSCNRKLNVVPDISEKADLAKYYDYCIRYPLSRTSALFAYRYRLSAVELNNWQQVEATIQQKITAMRSPVPHGK